MDKRLWFAGVCVGIAFWLGASSDGAAAEKYRLSYSAYTKISARRLETMRLTREGKFDAVEAIVAPLQQAYERGEVDELAVAIAFSPFRTSDESLAAPLDQWVAKSPKSYVARLARGRHLRARFRRFQAVERPLSKAAIGPERVRELAQRSIADLKAALALNPRIMFGYGDLLEMAIATDDGALFRECFAAALAQSPSTWPVRHVAVEYGGVSREHYSEFLADAAKHEQKNPLLLMLAADARIDRAKQLKRKGEWAQALAIYDRELATLDAFDYRRDRARLYGLLGRHAEARAEIDRAIALLPGKFDGYGWRAWLHSDLEQWPEAAADFRRGLELEPLDGDLNKGLSHVLTKLGDFAGAIRALEVSALWAPTASKYRQIGYLNLFRVGRPKKALAALEIAVAMDPADKWAWYYHAGALDELADPRAMESYRRFVESADPRSAEDQKSIAWAKRRMAEARGIQKPPANAAH